MPVESMKVTSRRSTRRTVSAPGISPSNVSISEAQVATSISPAHRTMWRPPRMQRRWRACDPPECPPAAELPAQPPAADEREHQKDEDDENDDREHGDLP